MKTMLSPEQIEEIIKRVISGILLEGIDFGNGTIIYKDASNRICIKYSNADKIKVGGASTLIANRMDPDGDNSIDLGRGEARYKDAYIARYLTNGEETFLVKEASDLITYAKAQGWIS